jgi:hypothetical protein
MTINRYLTAGSACPVTNRCFETEHRQLLNNPFNTSKHFLS